MKLAAGFLAFGGTPSGPSCQTQKMQAHVIARPLNGLLHTTFCKGSSSSHSNLRPVYVVPSVPPPKLSISLDHITNALESGDLADCGREDATTLRSNIVRICTLRIRFLQKCRTLSRKHSSPHPPPFLHAPPPTSPLLFVPRRKHFWGQASPRKSVFRK